jgi:hypothetical protein
MADLGQSGQPKGEADALVALAAIWALSAATEATVCSVRGVPTLEFVIWAVNALNGPVRPPLVPMSKVSTKSRMLCPTSIRGIWSGRPRWRRVPLSAAASVPELSRLNFECYASIHGGARRVGDYTRALPDKIDFLHSVMCKVGMPRRRIDKHTSSRPANARRITPRIALPLSPCTPRLLRFSLLAIAHVHARCQRSDHGHRRAARAWRRDKRVVEGGSGLSYRIPAANAMELSALAPDRDVADAYRELAQAYLALARLSERTAIRSLIWRRRGRMA